ncbi:hypothetical protein J6590_091173 [Homalodisca vitripennis]|nr:hypothetical protein J6590_091173 [Homalodisca vitripennis]
MRSNKIQEYLPNVEVDFISLNHLKLNDTVEIIRSLYYILIGCTHYTKLSVVSRDYCPLTVILSVGSLQDVRCAGTSPLVNHYGYFVYNISPLNSLMFVHIFDRHYGPLYVQKCEGTAFDLFVSSLPTAASCEVDWTHRSVEVRPNREVTGSIPWESNVPRRRVEGGRAALYEPLQSKQTGVARSYFRLQTAFNNRDPSPPKPSFAID